MEFIPVHKPPTLPLQHCCPADPDPAIVPTSDPSTLNNSFLHIFPDSHLLLNPLALFKPNRPAGNAV